MAAIMASKNNSSNLLSAKFVFIFMIHINITSQWNTNITIVNDAYSDANKAKTNTLVAIVKNRQEI